MQFWEGIFDSAIHKLISKSKAIFVVLRRDILTVYFILSNSSTKKISCICSETGAHTNEIESLWHAAKRSYETSSRRKEFYPGDLAKFMYLKNCKTKNVGPFLEFMHSIAKLYNPNNYEDLTLSDFFNDLNVHSDSESEADEHQNAWAEFST